MCGNLPQGHPVVDGLTCALFGGPLVWNGASLTASSTTRRRTPQRSKRSRGHPARPPARYPTDIGGAAPMAFPPPQTPPATNQPPLTRWATLTAVRDELYCSQRQPGENEPAGHRHVTHPQTTPTAIQRMFAVRSCSLCSEPPRPER